MGTKFMPKYTLAERINYSDIMGSVIKSMRQAGFAATSHEKGFYLNAAYEGLSQIPQDNELMTSILFDDYGFNDISAPKMMKLFNSIEFFFDPKNSEDSTCVGINRPHGLL